MNIHKILLINKKSPKKKFEAFGDRLENRRNFDDYDEMSAGNYLFTNRFIKTPVRKFLTTGVYWIGIFVSSN